MRMCDEAVVLGGGGFIGRPLVRRLLEDGLRVRVVSRSASPQGSHPGASYLRGDVSDYESMAACIRGASLVFHLATGGGSAWADFERDFIEGARNVARACLEQGVRRLVYTSSIAALYLGRNETVDDTATVDPKPERRSHYSRAKIAAEHLLRELYIRHNLPVVILRPGLVVGRGGLLNHTGVGSWPADNCCLGWGAGNNPLPFVLVQDVVQALASAAQVPGVEGKAFNLVGDVRLTAAEFVRLLAESSRRNFRFYPQSLLKMQAVEAGKWMLKVMARKPDNPFPSFRDLKSRSLRASFDCGNAQRVLGWKPNGSLEIFLYEAVASHFKPFLPGDLRRPVPMAS